MEHGSEEVGTIIIRTQKSIKWLPLVVLQILVGKV